MPEQLPKGWVKTTLGEVCLPVETIQPADTPGVEYTYFDIGGIDNKTNRIAETKTVIGRTAPSRARQAVCKDDILFSTVRTYLRTIARVERDYSNPVASTGFAVLRAPKGLLPQFLFFQILSEDFLQPVHALQSGTSYPAVRARDVFAQPILIPPTREQERIVAKLTVAFSQFERAERAARRAEERVQRYRAAVLNYAVTGESTRAWRDIERKKIVKNTESGGTLLQRLLPERRAQWEETELQRLRSAGKEPKDDRWKSGYREPSTPITKGLPKLPEDWTWVSPEQISSGHRHSFAIGPFGSDLKVSDYRESGVPLIFVRNIRERVFVGEGTRFVSSEKADELKAHQVIGGDILITKTGDPPGDACLYPDWAPIAIITADCIRLQLPRSLQKANAFFVHVINSTLGRKQILQITKGIAQQKVSLSRFSRIALPLPPLPELTEISREVDRRLSAAENLAARLEGQKDQWNAVRQSLLHDALSGRFVPQDPEDEPASLLLEHIRVERVRKEAEQKEARRELRIRRESKGAAMKQSLPSIETLRVAWQKMGNRPDARRLFDEAGFVPGEVVHFYEALRGVPEIRAAFEEASPGRRERQKPITHPAESHEQRSGRFRLIELWLEDFKNLKDYTVRFDRTQSLDVILGWNGTGKSNLFEALIIIFRDLHEWWEKNHWPDNPMKGFRLSYEMDEHTVKVAWRPGEMKRPDVKRGPSALKESDETISEPIRREQLPLPRFVFGYYSGPTNRLAEHFLPMKQAHYERLRDARADDPKTLAKLLEQRRFFCAETYQAKYVLLWFLLGFSHNKDSKINKFLAERLRIVGFESVLFIIRKPRWAKRGSKAEDFWDATGIMRLVMERLRRYAIAPMVLKQKVSYGYRSSTEDHYYFFLPDLESLHSFAAAYQDAQTFFMALESTDFSELIHDVKIQVRVKASNTEEVSITFHQMSEGEQQLLMVLGLMRFTKSHQSLVLLDEPDTHLNPHWNVSYLKDLKRVMSDNTAESSEQQTSQILMASHDPIVVASLEKNQVHVLRRDSQTGACRWFPASVNPRGLGFTGILTSDMFGFRSDLDPETLDDLDNRVRLVAKEGQLTPEEKEKLKSIDENLAGAGFSKSFSDPYYAAFVRAWGRGYSELMAGQQFLTPAKQREIDRIADELLKEAREEVEKKGDELMRFVDINLLELPNGWETRAGGALGKLRKEVADAELNARNAGQDPTAARTKAITDGLAKPARTKIWRDLSPCLARLRNQKCWYSESLNPTADKDVDHFRPKNRVEGDGAHEGYWWLAFTWRNYRYSSQWCNQRRVDDVHNTSGGKGDQFPLCPNGIRAREESDDIGLEFPALLDPINDQDWRLLTFLPNGYPTPALPAGTIEHQRAMTSIEVYHLHCKGLVDGRRSVAATIKRIIQDLEAFRLRIDDLQFRNLYLNREVDLLQAVGQDAEYSAAALAYARAEIYKLEFGQLVRRDWLKKILDGYE